MACISCSSSNQTSTSVDTNETDEPISNSGGTVVVTAVAVSGEENQYNFSITIESDDTGCDQYADWWEIIDFDGNLLFRRILTHSHVNEQPFTRSGGPVPITTSTEVYVRAHMNNSVVTELRAFKGNAVAEGLNTVDLSADFAKVLGKATEPLPRWLCFLNEERTYIPVGPV